MSDGLIDDEVRRSFPGLSDEEIREFYEKARKASEYNRKILVSEQDLLFGRIIRDLGWDAFKEYLASIVGDNSLDPNDYVALSDAVTYLKSVETAELYGAMFATVPEASSRKTVSARKKAHKQLMSSLDQFEIF